MCQRSKILDFFLKNKSLIVEALVSLGMFFVRFVAAILGGILEIGFQAILQMLLTLFKAVSTQQTFDLKTGGLKRSQFS